MMDHRSISSLIVFSAACLLLLMCSIQNGFAAKPTGGKGGGNKPGPVTSIPMALDHEDYYFRIAGEDTCLGEDDELDWVASGSLAPGESFSFTPQKGSCSSHPAAISVVANWSNGFLELSSTVPDADYSSWDEEQYGRSIIAPVIGQTAQLCMFPEFSGDGIHYTVTVTNISAETVDGIELHGRHENDWIVFYYPRCFRADADADGWNDSLEHTMANLVYPNGYVDGIYQPDILWGSNYLRARAVTAQVDDEIDSYPADINDDGWVDEIDQATVESHLGEGNGIPLEDISPNSNENSYHANALTWRRYDLDGDGFVGVEDVHIVHQLLQLIVPTTSDIISPTARITVPADGASVPRGQSVMIKGHAWDNLALSRVDYLVNGKIICSNTDPLPGFGSVSPFYFCWWTVPKRNMSHQLEVRAYDAAGNVTTSRRVSVNTY